MRTAEQFLLKYFPNEIGEKYVYITDKNKLISVMDGFLHQSEDIEPIEQDQLCLLEKYIHWCIDVRKPITIKKQIEIYNKRGFIEHGKNENELPTFEQWKLMF